MRLDDLSGDVGRRAALRLVLGLVQGLALGMLAHVAKAGWARGGGLWEVLVLLALYLPLVPLAGVGHMRARALAAWTLVAGVVLALLAAYDDWRRIIPNELPQSARGPSLSLLAFGAAALYVAHHLLEPALAARRWRAPYPAYVETAWRHAFQLAMALAFTGVLWGVMELAAGLFGSIGLKPLEAFLRSALLLGPVLGVGFAAAVHQTDVRPAMIEGVRGLALTLLAWLLPVAAGFAAAFLVALVFTGLKPLWATQRPAALLLAAALGLVVLVNAAYQDGTEAPARLAAVQRWAGRLAGLLVAPLVALAATGLLLRVGQHGLSANRVEGLAVALVLALYAAGYAWAAVRGRPWMAPLETVNVVAAGAVVLVLLAVLSPMADPARLAAADQLARLRSGRTPPDRFDFDALKFRTARFGQAALARLARSPDAEVARRARTAQRRTYPGEDLGLASGTPFSRARVLPAGAALPADFRARDWSGEGGVSTRYDAAACLVSDRACGLYVIDLDGDGAPEVVVFAPDEASPTVFARAPGVGWVRAGGYTGPSSGDAIKAAIAAGDVHPTRQPLPDLQVGPRRYQYDPASDYLKALQAAGRLPR